MPESAFERSGPPVKENHSGSNYKDALLLRAVLHDNHFRMAMPERIDRLEICWLS